MEGDEQFKNQPKTINESVDNFYDLPTNPVVPNDKRGFVEKIVISIVLLVAFFAVILGYYQLSRVMKKPFVSLLGSERTTENNCVDGDCDLQNQILAMLELKQKDTDGDGLSDYDELYVYGTSPFLWDSDGDGFSDKQEIDSGYDPNCPGNENCFTTASAILDPESGNEIARDILSGQSDPDTLRKLLIEQGFPKDVLNTITDEQLIITYQQALSGDSNFDAQSVSNNQPIGGGLSDIDLTSIDNLRNLTGAQVRELMISRGAPADILSQVSDDQLRDMFLSQLNSQAN